MHKTSLLALIALAAPALAQPIEPHAPLDWKTLEAPLLRHQTQITSRDQFIKAGEAYFSPDGNWIIFQATAVPEKDKDADPFYAMYVAKLVRDRFTGLVTGLDKIEKVSPDHTANTCGWFHPTQTGHVLFGSTLAAPKDEGKSGFQVGSRSYKWMFPAEMEVSQCDSLNILGDATKGAFSKDSRKVTPVFARANYDAECSYSKDGRFILYSHIEDHKDGERPDANIYIFDTKTGKHTPIVMAPGYDGGPFFSPDNKSICYRSDRKGNDLLQLFVADLKLDKDGVPTGLEHEYQLTNNDNVNWCPYWHPSGKYLLYGTSEVSHANYEIFAIESDMAALRAGKKPSDLRKVRITQADGADILPSFSPDGKLMMWTCQRGPKAEGEEKASSQLWIAEWTSDPFAQPATPTPVKP